LNGLNLHDALRPGSRVTHLKAPLVPSTPKYRPLSKKL
jgi:hypothetical protein